MEASVCSIEGRHSQGPYRGGVEGSIG
jgi:hypothetical protein